MEQRERELLARHRAEWERPVRNTGMVKRCIFRRGLVEGIEIIPDAQALRIDKVVEALSLAPITQLISRWVLDLGDCPALSRIASITVRPTAETLDYLLSSAHLGGLRELVLDHSTQADRLLEVLARWPALRRLVSLRLQSSDVTRAGVRRLLDSDYLDSGGPHRQRTLKTLDLRNNRRFTAADARWLVESGHSAPRRGWVEGLLAGVLGRVEKRATPPTWSDDTVVAELSNSNAVRRRAALDRLGEAETVSEAVPALVRRAFDPNLGPRARQELKRFRFLEAPARLAPWLDNWQEDAATWLDTALANESLPLPLKVQESFAELCQRRLRWRARHGRAAAAPQVPADACDDREKLRAVVALVADRAADAEMRHTPPECSQQRRAIIRRKARAKECAWLASWLVRLLA